MFKKGILSVAVISLFAGAVPAQKGIVYPQARKVEQVDNYHGISVKDPYRWMEETNSADTQAWIEAQNKITNAYLETIPERAKIKARLTELGITSATVPRRRSLKASTFTRRTTASRTRVFGIGRSRSTIPAQCSSIRTNFPPTEPSP